MRRKKRGRQIGNYFIFVAAGILFLVIVACISGCGSGVTEKDGSSGRKKELSKSEIQQMTDLVVVDAEEISGSFDEDEIAGMTVEESYASSH